MWTICEILAFNLQLIWGILRILFILFLNLQKPKNLMNHCFQVSKPLPQAKKTNTHTQSPSNKHLQQKHLQDSPVFQATQICVVFGWISFLLSSFIFQAAWPERFLSACSATALHFSLRRKSAVQRLARSGSSSVGHLSRDGEEVERGPVIRCLY